MNTIDLTKRTSKDTVITGAGVVSEKFITDSTKRSGYFSSAADASSGHLVRRMWISEKPGGKPLDQTYKVKGKTFNAADVSGAELKLSWTQGSSASLAVCKLESGKTYYLNHSQAAFSDGKGPTAKSALIRGVSVGGAR